MLCPTEPSSSVRPELCPLHVAYPRGNGVLLRHPLPHHLVIQQHGPSTSTRHIHRLVDYVGALRRHPVGVVVRNAICPSKIHLRYDHAASFRGWHHALRGGGACVLAGREQAEAACPGGIYA